MTQRAVRKSSLNRLSESHPYQVLEDRRLLAANLFVDFGDNFPGGTLATTQGAFRDVADAPADGDKILGTELVDSANGFNAGTALNIIAQAFTADERARMMSVIERAYLPLDIDVVELTATAQTTLDGRSVSAASSMADVINTLRGGDASWKDAYIFVGTFVVDPGGANQMTYGPGGGGLSPSSPTLGVQSDLAAAANLHDDVAVVYSGGGISNNTLNNISHEAGHLFGLRHAITNATPTASINLFHQLEIMSYRNTNNTTSSTFSRYPMIRGDDNSPAAPPNPVNYNDLAARNGQVTLYDQLRFDSGVLANPNYTFVSGTGAHDLITITRNGANADVTVQAFADSNYTTAITVPGEADTTFSYSIPLNRTILVYAGDSNDRIQVDADLGVDVLIDGMLGTDELIVDGKGLGNFIYTPNAGPTTSTDLLSNGTVLVDDYGGLITVGSNWIRFNNFEVDGRVEIQNALSLEFVTPNVIPPTGNDQLTVSDSPVAANRTRIAGMAGPEMVVPLEFFDVVSVVLQTGNNDLAIDLGTTNDEVTLLDPIQASGLQFFTIDTGEGDDRLMIDATGNLALPVPGGFFNFDGGTGEDTLFGSDDSPNWLLEGDRRGGLDGSPFSFLNTEILQGGSGDDGFEVVTTLPVNMELFGGLGTDTVFGPNAARTWNLTGPGEANLPASFLWMSEIEGVTGGNAVDTFLLQSTGLQIAIDGGGGTDSIYGHEVDETWTVGPAGGSTVQTAITFSQVERLYGGGEADDFQLEPGVINVDVWGGAGTDWVTGPNVDTTWELNGFHLGNVMTSAVMFEQIESIRPGTMVDSIQLGNGLIDMTIEDQGGSDQLFGPDLSRIWTLTGPYAGSINYNVVQWTGIENLNGGTRLDWFVFSNDAALVESIDGGTGNPRDHIDFSGRATQVDVMLTGLGPDGFAGQATGMTTGFTNVFRVTGTDDANDGLMGRDVVARWLYTPGGGRYVNGNTRLFFRSFERLLGGSQADYFRISPSADVSVMIQGGDPSTAPGDILTINFAGTENPRWEFLAPGAGVFEFDNRMAVDYSEIETLNVYDYGDALDSFGTLFASDGARHRLPALTAPIFLGSQLDPEGNGKPGALANRDDLVGIFDDEEGVIVPPVLIPHFRAAVLVTASAAAKLDAWIDFDGNGVFSDSERIADNLSVEAGQTRLEFVTPLDALPNVMTTARFRLSSQGNLGPTGPAGNGEVEDYSLLVQRPDPGDYGIYPDPFKPGEVGQQILVMAGTTGFDTMVIDPVGVDSLKLKINGTTYLPTTPSSQIQRIGAFGLEGNDTIILASNILQEGELYGDQGSDDIWGGQATDYVWGGSGNDNLYGNAGNDFLFGEAGNDSLFGNAGNDVLSGMAGNDLLYGLTGVDALFGGDGADSLRGQTGGDLLIGNLTDFDNDEHALAAILNEWTSANSYLDRVDNLNFGTGSLTGSGIALATGITIFDDLDDDEMWGGLDLDAFFSQFAGDAIYDLEPGEAIR